MIKKALPGLSLLTLSLFSGYVLANEATGASCEAVVQQLKQQADATNQLNTRLSMLLDQQGHTAKQLNEIKNLQQQLGKQLTPVSQPALYKKSNKKESAESCIPAEPGKTTPDGKMILGETEWIYVEEANGNFMSRVDTGATTSSISAHDVTVFEREGRRWVKFIMPIDGGKEINVEVPFVKYIRIRQANGLEDRPIVRMTIRLGSVTEKADFSLTDRSNMDFPVLLGREFMKDVAVVDVARENVQGKPKVADAVQASAKPKQLQVVKNLKASETETKTNNAANTVKEGDKVLTVKKVPVKDESGNAVSATDSSLKKEPPKNDSVSDVKPTVDLKKPSKEPVKTALPADAEPVKASSAAATTSDVNKDKQ